MRIWHYALLPYLSKLQFDGQLREIVAIKRDWETKGTTNHILINRVMEYPKSELTFYFQRYDFEYWKRYNKHLPLKYHEEFLEYQKRYESLVYQLENNLYDNDNDVGKKALYDDISWWNEDLAYRKIQQNNFWIGIFIPDIYDQFEFIKLGG